MTSGPSDDDGPASNLGELLADPIDAHLFGPRKQAEAAPQAGRSSSARRDRVEFSDARFDSDLFAENPSVPETELMVPPVDRPGRLAARKLGPTRIRAPCRPPGALAEPAGARSAGHGRGWSRWSRSRCRSATSLSRLARGAVAGAARSAARAGAGSPAARSSRRAGSTTSLVESTALTRARRARCASCSRSRCATAAR